MKNEQVFRAIMVVQQSLTPFAKQCLVEMAPKYILEVFQEQELLVNITRHTLVPTHQILSDDEKKTLLERYKVKETQLIEERRQIKAAVDISASRKVFELKLDDMGFVAVVTFNV